MVILIERTWLRILLEHGGCGKPLVDRLHVEINSSAGERTPCLRNHAELRCGESWCKGSDYLFCVDCLKKAGLLW